MSSTTYTQTVPTTISASVQNGLVGSFNQSTKIRQFPDDWKVYELFDSFSGPYEVGEAPSAGSSMFIGSLAVGGSGRRHIELFQFIHPDVKITFVGLTESATGTSVPSHPAFENATDHKTFEDWVESRIEVFGSRQGIYETFFPKPPKVIDHAVFMEKCSFGDKLIEFAAWAETNLKMPIYELGTHFIFCSEDDAMMYKLKYV